MNARTAQFIADIASGFTKETIFAVVQGKGAAAVLLRADGSVIGFIPWVDGAEAFPGKPEYDSDD